MLPLFIGAGLAGAGLIGSYASGAMKETAKVQAKDPNAQAYQYGGSADATQQWRDELAARQQQMAQRRNTWDPRLNNDIAAQNRALGRFEDMAAGRGPSLAREQLREGQAEAQRRQMALAAGASGGAAGRQLAERNAQRIGADAALDTNRAAAQIRAQEQMGAAQAAANLSTGMRNASQDGGFNAQRFESEAMGMRLGLEQQQMQGAMALDQAALGQDRWEQETNNRIAAENRQRKQALWGGLTSAGAGMMGMGLGGGGKLWPSLAIAPTRRRGRIRSLATTAARRRWRPRRRPTSRPSAWTCSRRTRAG